MLEEGRGAAEGLTSEVVVLLRVFDSGAGITEIEEIEEEGGSVWSCGLAIVLPK